MRIFTHLNIAHLKGLMGQFGLSSRWLKMSSQEKSRAILLLLDHLELWDREERLRGARAVLYLAQVKFFTVQILYH